MNSRETEGLEVGGVWWVGGPSFIPLHLIIWFYFRILVWDNFQRTH